MFLTKDIIILYHCNEVIIMPVTKSPFRYPGGKTQLTNYIEHLLKINNVTDTYIEPFAGGAGVAMALLLDGKVKNIIINDYDKSIYSVWNAILNKSQKLISMIENTEITLDEWHRQKNIHEKFKNHQNSIENAFSTLFLNRTNVSGIISGGPIGGQSQLGKYKIDCRFNKNKIIEKIKAINSRKNNITITRMDATNFIDKVILQCNSTSSFIFFDPPYYKQGQNLYLSFYNSNGHKKLAKKIQSLTNYRWITTYDCEKDILNMYSQSNAYKYSLRYSANSRKIASEYLFTNTVTTIDSFNNVDLIKAN